jgi:hypothetical protein
MEARKLAGQMAAICPFALLLGMGYSARQPVLGRPTLQYTDVENARLQAYSPIVNDRLPEGANAELIRRHADTWIRTAALQHLQALTPAYQEDMSEDNARSEIIGDWRSLVGQLNIFMRREVINGDAAAAVQDGTRLLRVCEILKYSDFNAFHLAIGNTSRAITLLGPMLVSASKVDQDNFKAAASTINLNRGKLPAMYRVIKANYEDYLVRRIGFGREVGVDMAALSDDEADAFGLSTGSLQRVYVIAVRDEAKLRENERTFLGIRFSPLKS